MKHVVNYLLFCVFCLSFICGGDLFGVKRRSNLALENAQLRARIKELEAGRPIIEQKQVAPGKPSGLSPKWSAKIKQLLVQVKKESSERKKLRNIASNLMDDAIDLNEKVKQYEVLLEKNNIDITSITSQTVTTQ